MAGKSQSLEVEENMTGCWPIGSRKQCCSGSERFYEQLRNYNLVLVQFDQSARRHTCFYLKGFVLKRFGNVGYDVSIGWSGVLLHFQLGLPAYIGFY